MKIGELWQLCSGEDGEDDSWVNQVEITDIVYTGSGEDIIRFGNEVGGMSLCRTEFLRNYKKS